MSTTECSYDGCMSNSGNTKPGSATKDFAEVLERIFKTFNTAFERDIKLEEFGVIPQESQKNNSPVHHMRNDHRLALESWCVPYLYVHYLHKFKCVKRQEKIVPKVLNNRCEVDKINNALSFTRLLVLLNPELTTAWNFRRKHVRLLTSADVERELQLVRLVGSRKPKMPEGFYYRRWVMEQALSMKIIQPASLPDFVIHELQSLLQPIERYSNNYHAWNYRLWLVKYILFDENLEKSGKNLVFKEELSATSQWMQNHVSDFSGMHYRYQLLTQPMNQDSPDCDDILEKELKENEERLSKYFGHESLWQYRKYILHALGLRVLTHRNSEQKFSDRFIEWIKSTIENEDEVVESIHSHLHETSKSFDESYDEIRSLNDKLSKRHLDWLKRHFQGTFKSFNK